MYISGPPPQDFDAVWRELKAIQAAFEHVEVNYIQFKIYNAAPARPRQGQLYYADGTNWNPGSGEGLYRYDGSTYNSVG